MKLISLLFSFQKAKLFQYFKRLMEYPFHKPFFTDVRGLPLARFLNFCFSLQRKASLLTRPVPGMGSESVGPKGHIGFCLPVFRSRAPGPAEYEKNPASSSLPAPGQRDLYFLTPAGVSPAGQARSIESTEQDSNLQRPKATDLQSACVIQFAYLSIERSGSFPGPLFLYFRFLGCLKLLCSYSPVPGTGSGPVRPL